jgi:hypothetical protein
MAQAKAWLTAGKALDSLSLQYRRPLDTEDPVHRRTLEQAFRRAQDEVCVANGLGGGYVEYLWVLQHVRLEKNRRLLDSLDASP